MHDDLEKTIQRLRIDEYTFIRIAHQWAFGKIPDLSRDLLELRVGGIIPLYAQRYLNHLKEKENAVP